MPCMRHPHGGCTLRPTCTPRSAACSALAAPSWALRMGSCCAGAAATRPCRWARLLVSVCNLVDTASRWLTHGKQLKPAASQRCSPHQDQEGLQHRPAGTQSDSPRPCQPGLQHAPWCADAQHGLCGGEARPQGGLPPAVHPVDLSRSWLTPGCQAGYVTNEATAGVRLCQHLTSVNVYLHLTRMRLCQHLTRQICM